MGRTIENTVLLDQDTRGIPSVVEIVDGVVYPFEANGPDPRGRHATMEVGEGSWRMAC
jgi:hypothetical protein